MSIGSHAALRLLFAAFCYPLLIAAPAAAAPPSAIETLPACTANTFNTSFDDDSKAASLGFTADFFGKTASTVDVNVNGSVTLDDMLVQYAPLDFTTTSDVIIAPFEADVDTTHGGSPITYGDGSDPADPATHYFCVNWVQVGYWGGHGDKLNSFQLVLRQTAAQAATGDFSITFNYDGVTWDTAEGAAPAAVGWSAGDGAPGHDFVQPGSFTKGALLDDNAATGLIHNSHDSGGRLGRYVFKVTNGPVAAGRLHGTVYRSDYSTPVAFAPVQICPVAGGPCTTRATNYAGSYLAAGLAPGAYDVTAFPRYEEGTASTLDGVTISGGDDLAPDIMLGDAPAAPPDGTSVTGVGTSPGGIPVVSASQPGTITTLACRGADVQYTIAGAGRTLAHGPMHQVPGTADPATYQASYPAMSTFHGDAELTIAGTCPGPGNDVRAVFDVYVVPTGQVTDTNGRPLAGATVTLQRAATLSGPFIEVPEGSPELGAGDRQNPSLTAANAGFGWDVVAGYYRILASRPGCVSASNRTSRTASAVVRVPPPAGAVAIRMFCGESPTGGRPAGGGPGGPVPTAASLERAVAASLSGQLGPLLRRLAKRLSTSRARSFKVPFNAVASGSVSLKVTRVGGRALTIARGGRTVLATGPTRLTVWLTSRGRSLLRAAIRAHRRTRLKLWLTFAPRLNGHRLPSVRTHGRFVVGR